MSKLSERQRLILTISVAVLISGGLLALILMDRSEIDTVREEIDVLGQRIQAADVEIRKTPGREDQVLVFRAVEGRELAVLPTQQRIAVFHRNLSTFLQQAGLQFQELPESQPVESGLAKGIYVTRTELSCEGDSASLLRFINMMENDPRLVAVKGLKVASGKPHSEEPGVPIVHEAEITLETYFYNPSRRGMKPVHIAGAESRLQDPALIEKIQSFQPERPDTYVLRPAASRRDPMVDPRSRRPTEDPAELQAAWTRQEAIVLDLENRVDDIHEKAEQVKAYEADGALFRKDRLQREIAVLLNEAKARLAQTDQMKSVVLPELVVRLETVRDRVGALPSSLGSRDLAVTRSVAEEHLTEIRNLFQNGAYEDVANETAAWAQFLEGKEVQVAARPAIEEIMNLRRRARTFWDFLAIPLRVTGTIVHPVDPARSVALVNGRPLHVGDRLDEQGDVSVAEIRRESVVFAYDGERIQVGRRSGDIVLEKNDPHARGGQTETVRATVTPDSDPR